ncbi:hypothetical protein E2I00_002823, partial [Balaenoptera physalus]
CENWNKEKFIECPSGVVNEDTFKEIYSQFFPQGARWFTKHDLFGVLDVSTAGLNRIFLFVRDKLHKCLLKKSKLCQKLNTIHDIIVMVFTEHEVPLDSTTYAHFLFNAFDTDHNGAVSFEFTKEFLDGGVPIPGALLFDEDFIKGLSILLRGTVQEKLNWAFNLYDINKDGYITKEEMLDIMKAIYDMMGKCTYPVLKEDAPRQHVETFFQKMDKNKDGVVTIDEFIESCQKDENIMRSMQLFENVI